MKSIPKKITSEKKGHIDNAVLLIELNFQESKPVLAKKFGF